MQRSQTMTQRLTTPQTLSSQHCHVCGGGAAESLINDKLLLCDSHTTAKKRLLLLLLVEPEGLHRALIMHAEEQQ